MGPKALMARCSRTLWCLCRQRGSDCLHWRSGSLAP